MPFDSVVVKRYTCLRTLILDTEAAFCFYGRYSDISFRRVRGNNERCKRCHTQVIPLFPDRPRPPYTDP